MDSAESFFFAFFRIIYIRCNHHLGTTTATSTHLVIACYAAKEAVAMWHTNKRNRQEYTISMSDKKKGNVIIA